MKQLIFATTLLLSSYAQADWSFDEAESLGREHVEWQQRRAQEDRIEQYEERQKEIIDIQERQLQQMQGDSHDRYMENLKREDRFNRTIQLLEND